MAPVFRPLPLGSTTTSDLFWRQWQEQTVNEGLPHQWKMCEETGRLENLRRCAKAETGGYQGYRFNDSDVYKLIEATAYGNRIGLDPTATKAANETIQTIRAAQCSDGYINSHVQLCYPENRWKSLHSMHEMYCIGHLIEAGVAMAQHGEECALLGVATRAAEHVCDTFGPGARLGYPGHPEIELALHRLSLEVRDKRFADTARWMIKSRGKRPSPFEAEIADRSVYSLSPAAADLFLKNGKYDGGYAQDDVPLTDQSRAVGHAVRAMYLYSGAADLLSDDPHIVSALARIWGHLTTKQTYVTGGIGSSGRNEGFGDDYDLPNKDAYAETCASIGLVMWAWRMFLATGEGRYVDAMERSLYNSALSGVSLDCKSFFYDNPLESDGRHVRQPWFACACCPPNIARLLLSVGQYCVAEGGGDLVVALPVSGTYDAKCASVRIEGSYPWSGDLEVTVLEPRGIESLSIRIPDWTWEAIATVNGAPTVLEPTNGLAKITREWNAGDRVVISYKMPCQWLTADPRILDCAGRVALRRGPLVYCLEETDLGLPPHHWSADTEEAIGVQYSPKIGPIAVTLEPSGYTDRANTPSLYSTSSGSEKAPLNARMVPYFAWSNRGNGAMQVWLRRGR